MFKAVVFLGLVSVIGCAGNNRLVLQPTPVAVSAVKLGDLDLDLQGVVLSEIGPVLRSDNAAPVLDCTPRWEASGRMLHWAFQLDCQAGDVSVSGRHSHRRTERDDDVTDAYAVRQAARQVARQIGKAAR